MAIGLGVIGFGLYQIYRGLAIKFTKHFHREQMSEQEFRWAVRTGRAGLAARGVVFGMIGWFLFRAALHFNPKEAGGLGEALAELASRAYGPWLLGLVALGLVAYGIYCFVLARYRRISV
jgi:hypothetical protein